MYMLSEHYNRFKEVKLGGIIIGCDESFDALSSNIETTSKDSISQSDLDIAREIRERHFYETNNMQLLT